MRKFLAGFLGAVCTLGAEADSLFMVPGSKIVQQEIGDGKVIRVAIVADIHVNTTYSEGCGYPLCRERGEYKMDGPIKLIEAMLDDLKEQYEGTHLDAILLTGDFVLHDLAEKDVTKPHLWESHIRPNLNKAYSLVREKFPNTLLVPCIGNNDIPYHYQTISLELKPLIYGDMYNMWFRDHPVNSKVANLDEIKRNFTMGGFYRIDIGEHLAVLNLNSLYMSCRNKADL
jgi:hypothetical protein